MINRVNMVYSPSLYVYMLIGFSSFSFRFSITQRSNIYGIMVVVVVVVVLVVVAVVVIVVQ